LRREAKRGQLTVEIIAGKAFTTGAVGEVVGIWRGAFSGNMRVSFQAARSIG
jgi:hypothetical protein